MSPRTLRTFVARSPRFKMLPETITREIEHFGWAGGIGESDWVKYIIKVTLPAKRVAGGFYVAPHISDSRLKFSAQGARDPQITVSTFFDLLMPNGLRLVTDSASRLSMMRFAKALTEAGLTAGTLEAASRSGKINDSVTQRFNGIRLKAFPPGFWY